jgi:23S rRNA (uracil1939-C5)-methyltransferase
VSAVETGGTAVRDLEHNAGAAGVTIQAHQSPVEAYLDALEQAPDFVLADPPRAGLGRAAVRALLRLKPPRISIVSCDPATLGRDLNALLAGGYGLDRLTLVDLFPQTFHIESVAALTLR